MRDTPAAGYTHKDGVHPAARARHCYPGHFLRFGIEAAFPAAHCGHNNFNGAEHIERVDCLVRQVARQQGLQSETLDEIVALVDERLAKNREAGSARQRGLIS